MRDEEGRRRPVEDRIDVEDSDQRQLVERVPSRDGQCRPWDRSDALSFLARTPERAP
jgi:hypothetical protein